MENMQKVDRIFSSSFDEFVENIFQNPVMSEVSQERFPLNNLGDYIELYKEKKVLESQISKLSRRVTEQFKKINELNDQLDAHKAKEKKLITQRNAANKANKNKSKFLATMSHEIRTPISGVIGTTTVLRDTELTDSQQEYISMIESCAQSLLCLINDVLDFSKIEAGELRIEQVDFNLKDIVGQVRDVLAAKAREKNIRFYSHILHDVPVWLHGDPLRIRQVLLNLTGNALKFTDTGSVHIEVTLEKEEENQVFLRFSVKDTGIGLTEEQKEHLFKSFSQSDPSITRKYGGTGLGLSISRKLTRLMGGKIGVKSERGKGSEFWFSLPLKRQPEGRKKRSEIFQLNRFRCLKQQRFKGLSILLVDDDPINRKISRILLEKEGFHVEVVESGNRAISTLEQQAFDLVLLDVEMPGMNGYEVTRTIREMEENSTIPATPIIAMTAHAMTGDREKCLDAGMDDYISKPLNMIVLTRLIEQHVSIESGTAATPGDSSSEAVEDNDPRDHVVVNMKQLEELKKDVEDKFELVIRVFLDSLPEKLKLIRQAFSEGSFESLKAAAHQLKGSSSTFYAPGMTELCRKLEEVATDKGFSDGSVESLTDALEIEAERVDSILRDYIS